MTTTTLRDSAKIYEFPAAGRTSRNRASTRGAAHPASPKFAKAEYGSGWYHDAAVEEAERASESARPVRHFVDRH